MEPVRVSQVKKPQAKLGSQSNDNNNMNNNGLFGVSAPVPPVLNEQIDNTVADAVIDASNDNNNNNDDSNNNDNNNSIGGRWNFGNGSFGNNNSNIGGFADNMFIIDNNTSLNLNDGQQQQQNVTSPEQVLNEESRIEEKLDSLPRAKQETC